MNQLLDMFRVQFPNIDTTKEQFLDSVQKKKKGIEITATLSASARKINNRIYTPQGQRNGVSTWTTPFKKPILVYHNDQKDPIGRIVQVTYKDNAEAKSFFKSPKDFQYFLSEVDSYDPKRMYDALKKFNLLNNPHWPGLGILEVRAHIVDEAAIERFVDERYLTFSAGSHSDRYICSICLHDWMTGSACDHIPGKMYEDDTAVMITGAFYGDEFSVVNNPANSSSVIRSIKFLDSENTPASLLDSTIIDETTINTTISILENTPLEASMDLRKLLFEAVDSANFQALQDALNGDGFTEQKLLIHLHDMLHAIYDFDIRWSSRPEDITIPKDVFKVHGTLHETASSKNFRDAFINGALDNYSSAGEKSEEYTYKKPADSDISNKQLLDAFKAELDSKIQALLKDQTIEDDDVCVEDDSIDWYLLDCALDIELADAKLSTEKRNSLPDKSFCGPGRSFPVSDCAHVTAARRLIGRAKLSEDQKSKVLACVDRKAKKLSCDTSKRDTQEPTENPLQKDYVAALSQVETLRIELENVKKALDEAKSVEQTKVVMPTVVENPSIANNDTKSNKKLGDYEQKCVTRYKEILSKHNKDEADKYIVLQQLKGYLPPTFKITSYIEEK